MEDQEDDVMQQALVGMQSDLEAELTSLGGLVGRFRGLDSPEGEDLARNTLRAYDAVADVVRMVRELRGPGTQDDVVEAASRAGPRLHTQVPAVEMSARDFFAGEGGEGSSDRD
jgi:hypothetical protein